MALGLHPSSKGHQWYLTHEETEAQTDDLPKVTQLVNGTNEAQPLTVPKYLWPQLMSLALRN